MATKTYTADDIRDLILSEANKVEGLKKPFTTEDAEQCYAEAVMECGYEVPVDTDTDKDIKNFWMLRRMRVFFLRKLLGMYVLRFDAKDLKASQLVDQLRKLIKDEDSAFISAKELLPIFSEAADFAKNSVIGTGIVEDRIGQQIETRS